MRTLREIFARLDQASLTLNLAKCDFGKATILYLGREVGQGSVRTPSDKIQAVLHYPVPRTRRELRRFLGMAGYFRTFCKNFSVVALPLTNLLKAQVEYKWTCDCQKAFESLKGLLCSAPVLAAPDFTRPFKLEVDACDTGAGAVLIQENHRGVDRPVCFYSKKFNNYQQHYSTIEKETIALLLALQHFEVYLNSHSLPTIVYTDHNPLVFLSQMCNKNQRLMRWALLIQPFHIVIKHKKGSDNVVADALSRAL